ncbi:thiol:disulfide interchange protein DsbG [Thiohalorhabdus methylotrophus]|uniref:Thiol:disulfide interchange protein n=1 Tax=Thiohalorhabdus methylotrophus TaxID=3242694 RepID=A0ABV4TVI1_9GAMM
MPRRFRYARGPAVIGRAALLLLAGALVSPAAAEPPGDLPPAVQALKDQGLHIVNRFDAPGNLTGYAARAGGREVILYATPDGQQVLAGTMLGADGSNLTQKHLDAHMPKPDFGAAWGKLEEASWVAAGAEDPERVVYVFTDPNCPYCHALWKATVPYYEEGLQVRYLPVAVLRSSSLGKSAAILRAEDSAAAIRRHEQAFDQGGIEPLESTDGPAAEKVRANTELMQELGVQGTPTTFYKTEAGAVKTANGMPSLDRLAEIYRLPKQDTGDPALSRFR